MGIAFFGWLSVNGWLEYKRCSRQGAPEAVTIETASLTKESPRKWVTLRGGVWHCDRAAQVEWKAPERWLLGRVDSTQIPVTDAALRKLIVVKFDGDGECREVAGKPVTGVLVFQRDGCWGGSVSRELKDMAGVGPILVLCAGAGPKKAWSYGLLFAAFCVPMVWFTRFFARIWMKQRRKAPPGLAFPDGYLPR